VFEIPGDDGVLPWIGRNTGRGAFIDFIRRIRSMTEPGQVSTSRKSILQAVADDQRRAIVLAPGTSDHDMPPK
jgi:hypothetical protein